jgi:hypothetical protein
MYVDGQGILQPKHKFSYEMEDEMEFYEVYKENQFILLSDELAQRIRYKNIDEDEVLF